MHAVSAVLSSHCQATVKPPSSQMRVKRRKTNVRHSSLTLDSCRWQAGPLEAPEGDREGLHWSRTWTGANREVRRSGSVVVYALVLTHLICQALQLSSWGMWADAAGQLGRPGNTRTVCYRFSHMSHQALLLSRLLDNRSTFVYAD